MRIIEFTKKDFFYKIRLKQYTVNYYIINYNESKNVVSSVLNAMPINYVVCDDFFCLFVMTGEIFFFFRMLLDPTRQTFIPHPYTFITLLSFHHCSSNRLYPYPFRAAHTTPARAMNT